MGSNLAHEMVHRYPEAEYTVVDDFRSGSFKNLEGFKGDVIAADLAATDLKRYFAGSKVDLVFHLASITDTTDHNQFRQVHDNVESWRNILNYFDGRKTRLVYASSAATYGIAAGLNKIDQEPKPANAYAFSKVQLDNLARRWTRQNPGQIVVGLRYFNVYGPREAHKGAASSMILQLARQMRGGAGSAHLQARRAAPRFRLREGYRELHHPGGAGRGPRAFIMRAAACRARSTTSSRISTGCSRPTTSPSISTTRTSITSPTPRPTSARPHGRSATSRRFTLEQGIDDYLASGFLV